MLAGELYDGFNVDLLQERCHARRLLRAYNNSAENSRSGLNDDK